MGRVHTPQAYACETAAALCCGAGLAVAVAVECSLLRAQPARPTRCLLLPLPLPPLTWYLLNGCSQKLL